MNRSITIQVSTTSSVVTVKMDDQTQITKTDAGALSDLQEGESVTVFSREPSDTPTASAIRIQRGTEP